ncbi:hypothetical protein Dsin_015101 [Dipteronia sinensis]|uniref:Uncharacterized protein n=1 Tax=Dipteronia sinensis TaxID=43782 RepID=A0AAE0AN74_9ROSI|nr:hypothetical protein Dsin_015101 [Dipteronia sinensis]
MGITSKEQFASHLSQKTSAALLLHLFESGYNILVISPHSKAPFFRISVTFVDKDGEDQLIKVPIGMSLLEAAHENDIELEGKHADWNVVINFTCIPCLGMSY